MKERLAQLVNFLGLGSENTLSSKLGLLEIITIIFANVASHKERNGDCQLLDLFYIRLFNPEKKIGIPTDEILTIRVVQEPTCTRYLSVQPRDIHSCFAVIN